MSISVKKWLIREFDKEKNILGYMSDTDVLIRIEKKVEGKRHYYFNIAAFFDPDRGFLKCFSDLYERYKEIKNLNPDDIMPFASLISSPLEKIQEKLKIVPGSFLDYSLTLFYSIGFGFAVNAGIFLLARIHPLLGGVAYCGFVFTLLYEIYKGGKEIKKIEILKKEDEILVSRIFDLFSSVIKDKILDANVIEIVIDESYQNFLQAIVTELFIENIDNKYDKEKVKIKLWNIPEIKKAKRIKEFPDLHQKFICGIIEEIKKCKDKNIYTNYIKFGEKYRETYKKMEDFKNQYKHLENEKINLEKENNELKIKKDKIKILYDELDEIRKKDPNDPKIDALNNEIKNLLSL
jgi:hypothetical protein